MIFAIDAAIPGLQSDRFPESRVEIAELINAASVLDAVLRTTTVEGVQHIDLRVAVGWNGFVLVPSHFETTFKQALSGQR